MKEEQVLITGLACRKASGLVNLQLGFPGGPEQYRELLEEAFALFFWYFCVELVEEGSHA